MSDPIPLTPEFAEPSGKPEKLEKALRKLEAERGLLDPADRYKALVNAMKYAQDLIELGDRKARFALVVMSVMNAVLVLLVARGGTGIVPPSGPWALAVAAELAVYVVLTVFYLTQAISALRPRAAAPPPVQELPSSVRPGESMRVLFHADVAARDKAAYQEIWGALRMDNLNTELTDQLHTVSWITQRKYEALDRLYGGLSKMTLLLGLLLATLGLYHLLY